MATQTNQIVVEFVPDTSQLEGESEKLTQKEQKAFDDGNKKLAERAALVKDNVIAYANELKAVDAINKAFDKQFKSAKTIGQQIQALGNAFDAAFKTGGADSVTAVYEALGKELEGTGVSVEQFITQMKALDPATAVVVEKTNQLNESTTQTTEKTVTLNSELNKLRNQLAQSSLAGQENTTEFKKMQARAVELTQAIRETNSSVVDGAKGVDTIHKVSGALSVAAASFGLVQGAAALFGEQNDQVTKSLAKINEVMLIVNGLEQISITLKQKDNLITKALTVTQNAFTTALYGTTEGLTAVQLALARTGIGLFIVAIGIAVTALVKWITTLNDATKAVEQFNLVTGKFKEILDDRNKATENATQVEIEQAKQRNATAADEVAIRIAGNQKLLRNAKVYTESLIQYQKDLKDETSATYQAYNGNEKERLERVFQTGQKIKDAKKDETNIIRQNDLLQQQYNTALYQANKKAAEDNAKALTDISARTFEYIAAQNRATVADQRLTYDQRLSALLKANDNEKKAIETNREQELKVARANAETTGTMILDIQDKYNVQRENADNDYFRQKEELTREKERAIAQEAIQVRQAGLEAQLAVVKKGTQDELNLKNELVREQAKLDEDAATRDIQNTTLRAATILMIEKQADEKILENNKAFHAQQLQEMSDYAKALHDLAIAQNNLNTVGADRDSQAAFETSQKNRLILINENLDAQASLTYQFQTGQIQDEKEYQTKLTQLQTDGLKLQTDQLSESIERRKKIREAERDAAIQIAQGISDAIFDIGKSQREAQLQQQLDDLDTQRERELDNKNLTEQQKADIDARYDAKEKQIQKQAAQREKDASVAQALINAALAVTKALSSVPFPFNIIAAATTAALATVQVIKIKNTPLGFAKGTKNAPPGTHWVGEEGPELRSFKGGEVVYTNKESMQMAANWESYQNAHARNMQTASDWSNRRTPPELLNVSPGGVTIDYDKFANKVGEVVAKNQRPVIVNSTLDRNGWDQSVSDGQSRRRYLNKRYKINL